MLLVLKIVQNHILISLDTNDVDRGYTTLYTYNFEKLLLFLEKLSDRPHVSLAWLYQVSGGGAAWQGIDCEGGGQ